MGLSMEEIEGRIEAIQNRKEAELARECALRGIKYKPKIHKKMKHVEFNDDLDKFVKGKINGRNI